MKRKTILLTAVICMLFGWALAEPVNSIPEAGEKMNGFTVTSVEEYKRLDAKIVYMEHDKTGGPLIWIANDDTERSFTIGFKTHYENDKGVPHVFEHAALSGSEKYPDPQLFFAMVRNTCQTYLNASTYPFQTIYPCASISDKQLLKFADFYLAGVFEPLVLTDIHAMQREAYRYELENADADLNLTGTVYSEMLGAYYANENYYKMAQLEYPGSWYATCSGGKPGMIETMTQQDLIDFHNTYYQPSNALTVLYGDLDLNDFTALVNTYYDRYEKVEVSDADPGYEPFNGYSEVSADVSASADSMPETELYYCIPLRGLSDGDIYMLACFLPDALKNDASALNMIMMERFPVSAFSISVDTTGAEPMLQFTLGNAGSTTAAEFSESIQEGIAADMEEGIHYEVLETIYKSIKKSDILAREASDIGVNYSTNVITSFAIAGSPDSYFRDILMLEASEEWLGSGILEKVIDEQLIQPANARVITINKVPGMQEEMEAAAAQKLIDKKAAMSAEEIEQTIEGTREYRQWAESLNEISMINEVNVLTVDELPEEISTVSAQVTSRNGIRYITSEIEAGEMAMVDLYFDTGWIPAEKLPKYAQLIYMELGRVSTLKHSYQELSVLKDEYGISFAAGYLTDGADSSIYIPIMRASIQCLTEDLPDAVALVDEILTESRFDEYDLIRYNAYEMLYALKEMYPQSTPHTIITGLAAAATSDTGLYTYYLSDLPFAQYLEQVCAMDDDMLAAEADVWKELADGIRDRRKLQAAIISDAAGIEKAMELCQQSVSAWPYSVREAVDYSAVLEKLPGNIAVKIPGSACYNLASISAKDAGFDYTPDMDILSSLVMDQILIPVMRYQNGVYSPIQGLDEKGLRVLAYRDPSPVKTFDEVIPSIAKRIADIEIDEQTLNNLVVSGYTQLAMPEGPISRASAMVNDLLTNSDSQQEKLHRMTAYKELTCDKLTEYAYIYDALAEKGVHVTAGPASVIEANAERYDLVIDWYME